MKLPMILGGAALLALSACANPPPSNVSTGPAATPRPGTPPMSNAGASSSAMPQSPNSLPPGDRVNAPVASPAGNVSTTRVGPSL